MSKKNVYYCEWSDPGDKVVGLAIAIDEDGVKALYNGNGDGEPNSIKLIGQTVNHESNEYILIKRTYMS